MPPMPTTSSCACRASLRPRTFRGSRCSRPGTDGRLNHKRTLRYTKLESVFVRATLCPSWSILFFPLSNCAIVSYGVPASQEKVLFRRGVVRISSWCTRSADGDRWGVEAPVAVADRRSRIRVWEDFGGTHYPALERSRIPERFAVCRVFFFTAAG